MIQDEGLKVLGWRAECLWDAGLRDVEAAEKLAQSDCDLHQACEMIQRGLEPNMVVFLLT